MHSVELVFFLRRRRRGLFELAVTIVSFEKLSDIRRMGYTRSIYLLFFLLHRQLCSIQRPADGDCHGRGSVDVHQDLSFRGWYWFPHLCNSEISDYRRSDKKVFL